MEIREEVRVVMVDKSCPYCHQGFLRPTGVVCSTNPPARPHKCNNPNCDYGEVVTGNAYPYVEYLPVDNRITMSDGEKITKITGKQEYDHEKFGYPLRKNAQL